ncbi:MAG: hypothetical protein Fur0046_38340 [Cyanobacteria bacterium J069]
MIVTPDELLDYRTQLTDHPGAIAALTMLEDCEGDLEDAAIALALRDGQEPDQSGFWLDGFAKRWRVYICQSGVRSHLEAGAIAPGIQLLAAEMVLPINLATLVAIYVQKTGVEAFCKPLEERL